MAGINVYVKPEIIGWILSMVSFDNTAASVIDLLCKWQTGEKTPTFHQVEAMSRKTNIPFGYFFLDEPPVEKCPILEYRTVDSASISKPSRNLIDTVDLMTDVQEWMTEYAMENDWEELRYVGSAAGIADPLAVARDIRDRLEIQAGWFADTKNAGDAFRFLRSRMETIRILIMMNGIVGNNTRRKLDIKEFRAFSLVNKHAPLIFVNSRDSEAGRLFSLLHELAHIWAGENSFYNAWPGVHSAEHGAEKLCNAVAAEILVPTEIFLEKWESSQGDSMEKFEKLAHAFRCSRFVVVRKALDCGKISKQVYEQTTAELARKFEKWQDRQKEKKGSGGDFYRNLASKTDRNVIAALARSASEGRTQYTEMYRLTNTNRKTFGKLLDEIGGIV